MVDLNPTRGSEIFKKRPALVISPDESNKFLKTVIIAPMTSKGFHLPTRVACEFQGKEGLIVLDQIRAVDKVRLTHKLGVMESAYGYKSLEVLQIMFNKN